MAVIPIAVEPQTIHINADRRLAYQVVTAFGAGDSSNRVLEDAGDRKLVEFVTPVNLGLGMKRDWVTNEWIELTEPELITFNLVPSSGPITGGLKLLNDRFIFKDLGDCMELTYESTFGIRWSIPGWILGKMLIERFFKKHMELHLQELKDTVESRAARSRVYPQKACVHDAAVSQAA